VLGEPGHSVHRYDDDDGLDPGLARDVAQAEELPGSLSSVTITPAHHLPG
jgi:hypothetical protein